MLQAVTQALAIVAPGISAYSHIYPYLFASYLNGEDLNVIGKLVESAASLHIEACGVPVAGQYAVATGAAIQGKPHVRAAVVKREDAAILPPQDEHSSFDVDGLM